MKSILVPTDFSKNANHALAYAVALAKKTETKIILLHAFHMTYVVNPDLPMQLIAEQIESTEQEAKSKLKALQTKIIKSGKIKCDILNLQGLAVDMILETIEKKKPDFVVMGTKGASGIKEIILGSNTAKVISHATCPVIAVPEVSKTIKLKKITYATDYLSGDLKALKKVVELAEYFKSAITILHISNKGLTTENEELRMKSFMDKVKEKIKYKKIIFEIAKGKYLIKVLEDHVKTEAPDLMVMSSNAGSLFDNLFGTSVTKKVSYHTKIPLLAFHFKHQTTIL